MLEEIKQQLSKNKNMEDILQNYDWKKFENIIAEIFRENGFRTKQNFRFKTKRRYEIDIIAVKSNVMFCVDCKWWNKGRYKKSGLRNAIKSQEERTKELQKFLKKNTVAKSMLKITENYIPSPLLVTLHDEIMIKEGETFIIPIWKLNRFVTEVENYF